MPKKRKRKLTVYDKRLKDAINKHNSRSTRAKRIDESKTSKKVYDVAPNSWFKNPANSDVRNIDTKKHKAKSINEVIGFLKGTSKFNKKSFAKPNVKTRTLVKLNKQERKNILQLSNIRYNNVSLSKRKKKNTPNQYWIKIKK